MKNKLFALIGLLIIWFVGYSFLPAFSKFLTYDLMRLSPGTHWASSVEFFLYDYPKVMLLLAIVVFGIGIIRTFFTAQRTRQILAGKNEFVGNILAALLGVVTPFCSCSAVPLFIGFVTAGVPLGVTFSFLISAPMINEIALVLLFGLFGWKIALIYLCTGLTIAVVSGWVIGHLHMEKFVAEWVKHSIADIGNDKKLNWSDRIAAGWYAVIDIVSKVWIFVMLGIAVGAFIHGFVPENFLVAIMGKKAWWSVPLAVVIGIPLYSNAAGIIPIVQALLEKGAALGTVLAFMMSVIGLSLPEIIILRKVLKPKLIAVFVGVVGCGILIVGFLFNLIF
ncbi:MAG: permease [Candidatus Omnitrophica bacterium]|nr:permease [Candidatus Omnitrophota bacterium]